MSEILNSIIKESNYRLTQFSDKAIDIVEKNVVMRKDKKGKEVVYVNCLVRNKEIKLTPEELVRQLYIYKLITEYKYPVERMELEYNVTFGREKKRADIVIFDKDYPTSPQIIVELKKPKLKDGKEQLRSYCNATGAIIGVWTNGEQISFYHRKDPNYFEDIPNIPKATEKLTDILKERWTIDDLIAKDKLVNERKSLKSLIEEMEDEVLANAGVDVFEEVFKLIFTKLYDEMESGRNKKRFLEFRNYGDTESDLKIKIQTLFDKSKEKWVGVFNPDEQINLTSSHLSVCVASLQDVKLFNSNLDVVDDAFEYLMSKSSKGEKGQFFTPRYVIDMCVKMLNPKENEKMIDTAAGSCGFPVHTIFHVWKQMLAERGIPQSHLFTTEKKPPECEDYVRDNVFAIDFDVKAVRVARTLNLIAGDGRTNVMHFNTLDYERWDDFTKDEKWTDIYNDGWRGLRKLRKTPNQNRDFKFDILMANPPFAGDIKESRIIAKYELGKNAKGKYQTKVGRDILFIERNLSFLKDGGRMAIVLPQGRFNNSSDKYIRDYIAERCRILAVVGLHVNVFKPHTGTKTSVLFVQKWDDELCPKKNDYPIFFATMREPSKDNSGEKIYRIVEGDEGAYMLDDHHHLVVKHDLYNHDGLTEDGIAEAFEEFAKREGLSFFQ
ncbi:N-6 DNA methylase [Clostridium taeniosporum]|uniref:SAM-dependent methyltransferase n=1 Tax=Clostridium taeniosporum TaxID=394958 RepID=A0A1D7XHX8_9CLOT|nr:N-6 DNA methylase [Clostridium taeniosporum]AOR22699.1 SAM-dependent methyltransferase [Clostridium taeniosporum]